METYQLKVCGLVRELPYIPIDEKSAYASFVVLGDTELVVKAAGKLAEFAREADIVLTAEAKGIALAHEVTKCLGKKEFLVARKSVKSYMQDPFEEVLHSITTQGEQRLYLDQGDAEKIKGKKVCLVDDVISTGESLQAMENLVNHVGATVVCRVAILAEGDAANRDDICYLEKLPLFKKEGGRYQPMD
jgi:adenine phosphoribosyltransferase